MVTLPPRELLAAAARRAVEEHDEWDTPHCFEALHWDGEKLLPITHAVIMPDVRPADYPAVMRGISRDHLDRFPGKPPHAYLLQVEAFAVKEPLGSAGEERRRFNADRRNQTFHKRPDAVEVVSAYCADVHGRLWVAEMERRQPGVIREEFYGPHTSLRPGGQLIAGLVAVAHATGVVAHGLPPPHLLN